MKKIKFILDLVSREIKLFPIFVALKIISNSIKNYIMDDFWNSDLGITIKLYSLTIIPPLILSILIIIMCILNPVKFSVFSIFDVWSDFYISGLFLDVVAWRWQTVLLLISFLIAKFDK